MIRTQIQITVEQHKLLKKIASLQKVSLANLIRTGIDVMLKAKNGLAGEKGKKQRALAATGRFHSEHGRLSETHDEALAEAYKT